MSETPSEIDDLRRIISRLKGTNDALRAEIERLRGMVKIARADTLKP